MYFLLLVLKEKYQWPEETWCQGYQSITNQMSTCICFQIWKTRKTHKVCHREGERERERDEQIYTNRELEMLFICGIAMHAMVFQLFIAPILFLLFLSDTILTLLPEYRGYPSVTTLVNGLRKQVYSMPKDTLTHTTLSEKNW